MINFQTCTTQELIMYVRSETHEVGELTLQIAAHSLDIKILQDQIESKVVDIEMGRWKLKDRNREGCNEET